MLQSGTGVDERAAVLPYHGPWALGFLVPLALLIFMPSDPLEWHVRLQSGKYKLAAAEPHEQEYLILPYFASLYVNCLYTCDEELRDNHRERIHMATKRAFGLKKRPAAGWRQSAKVNCAVLLISSVALTVLAIVVLARGSLKPVFFYAADCDSGKVATRNLALHLLINIASTLVAVLLASSNFFMQVLNAPTREEVDNAHFKSSWLGIGVPSVRNAFRVSPFKTWCWISLLLSSIPIHLLFNSAVFEVDSRESDFHLTIATEQFLRSGDFYPPGSSLAIPALVSLDDSTILNNNPDAYYYTSSNPWDAYNYGYPVNKTDYEDHLSPVVSNISAVSKEAVAWERLEIAECKNEYVACKGLKKRRSVVLVVDNPGGWVWNDIWQLNETESKFWDQYIPSSKPNHLFFDAQCAMVAETTRSYPGVACINNCVDAFGNYYTDDSSDLNTTDWNYPFFIDTALSVVNGSEPDAFDYRFNLTEPDSNWTASPYHTMTSGLQKNSFNLSISYCLAEPLENICRMYPNSIEKTGIDVVMIEIGLSPTLLLAVALCVIAKTITAVVVTIVLNLPAHKPLVTLGDAVASFIEHPDPVTAGLCTINQKQVRTAMRRKDAYLVPGPRQWTGPQQTWAAAIPIPYNNLFTRLQMAKEWARFGEGYNSLRVTEPRGQQYSTYRLQLPYKYSIPLIVASASLHWLVSNTIYVFVSTGDSFTPPYSNGGDPSLPTNTAVAVGYSLTSLVTLIIVSSVLVTIPLILAFKRLPSNITQPGSNSLAISAACHSSTISRASRESVTANDSSLSLFENTPSLYTLVRTRSSADLDVDLSSQSSPRKDSLWRPGLQSTLRSWFSEKRMVGKEDGDKDGNNDDIAQSPLRSVAQRRLRWGVISMSAEWYDEYDHDGPVEHLGFGVEEDNPKDPIPGQMNRPDKGSSNSPFAYSPVLNHIDLLFQLKQVSAQRYHNQSIYVGQPSPEVDAVWDRIQEAMIWGISGDDMLRIGKDASKSIHCLNVLRKGLVTNYDYNWGQRWGFEPPIDFKTHLRHCTSLLLQSLICHADVEIIMHEGNEEQPWPFPDFGVAKQCRVTRTQGTGTRPDLGQGWRTAYSYAYL
ncbi:hypothetical protein CHU98_g744 [Xylaria longipes]|nr:hypothetical protein CHU98_g744 [Xylaria longipes]